MSRLTQKRKRNDQILGLILGTLGILVLASLAATVWYVSTTKIALGPDNCPLAGPRAVHLIMIDQSDPISDRQAQRVRQVLQRAKDNAILGTRFDVYSFDGDSESAMQSAPPICAPGKPQDANALIENPERARARYEQGFSKPLDARVDALLTKATRPTSPILESLRGAAQTSFGTLDLSALPLRVTIISDLVQHSGAVSHFRGAPNFDALAGSFVWSSLRPQLKGAEVEVLYILRPSTAHIQNRGHQAFWEQVIHAGGGTLVRIEPL